MRTVKVLIADDSVVYRSQIRAALSDLPFVEVVGVAANGRVVLDRFAQLQIDLLILDLEMPEMNGLETLIAMKAKAIVCKTLVFSSVSKRGAEITLEALTIGASDFITKPGNEDVGTTLSDSQPSRKIRALLEPKILALFPELEDKSPSNATPARTESTFPKVIWELFNPKIIVMGSSTGGPTVLETIFSALSGPLRCPILITQHMPPIFTASLAERLARFSGIPACEAAHGMVLETNRIYVAPGNYHMSLIGNMDRTEIVLDQGPLVNSVRPSADPLFSSAAGIFGRQCLGIVLTGMGADGKVGAQIVKQQGGSIIIQNEKSCVVFGMPGAVMAAGAYDKILNPEEIIIELQNKTASVKNQIPGIASSEGRSHV